MDLSAQRSSAAAARVGRAGSPLPAAGADARPERRARSDAPYLDGAPYLTRPTVLALCLFLLLGAARAFADGAVGVSYADSGDFTLDTTTPPVPVVVVGVAYADSGDFALDTTTPPVPVVVVGVAYADSGDFALDTTTPPVPVVVVGVAYADSGDFTLDTTIPPVPVVVVGVAYADSGDFTLDTTTPPVPVVVVGVAYADSSDFTLNTLLNVDIGLRMYDGATIIRIACEPPGTLTSPLRISKNGTTYGILLTAPNGANASKFRIQTSSGVKALMTMP